MIDALGSLGLGVTLTIVGILIAAVVGGITIYQQFLGGKHNAKMLRLQESQASGQPEKRTELRKGLKQYSTKLSELTSRLTPNPIDTSRPYVNQQLHEVRNELPDLEGLQEVANTVAPPALRRKVVDGLEAARVWRFAIDHAWRQVENLELWEVDTRDRREEALHWFSIERHDVHVKHEVYRTPILEAIDAIDTVERREDLAVPPGDNVLRRTARRLGAHLTKFGTIN